MSLKPFSRLLLAAAILLIIGCEAIPEKMPVADIEIVTAEAVLEIEHGCEYENGSLCDQECCYFDNSCKGTFKKCDLDTGEWDLGNYSDSFCSKLCDIEKPKPAGEDEKNKTKQLLEEMMQASSAKEQETCTEGWVCLNSSWKGYQSQDCSILYESKCESGCENSKCKRICEEGALKCKANKLLICKDGYEWKTHDICENGCEDNECILQTDTEGEEEEFQETGTESCQNSCIEFKEDESNFSGSTSDCTDSKEHVVFSNDCSSRCSITNWTLYDLANTTYVFPEFSLDADSSVKVITGKGTNSETVLYWDRCSAVWNNGGDTVFLKNRNNEIVIQHTYP